MSRESRAVLGSDWGDLEPSARHGEGEQQVEVADGGGGEGEQGEGGQVGNITASLQTRVSNAPVMTEAPGRGPFLSSTGDGGAL